jgi:hypothetical protein
VNSKPRSSGLLFLSLFLLTACAPLGGGDSEGINADGGGAGQFSDDIGVIDRGLQEGRSKHAGWAAPAAYEVDPVFDSPWPTEITRKQLIDSALAQAFQYFDEKATSDQPSNLTIYFEDTFPEEHRQWVVDMARVSATFPSDFTDHQFNLMVGEPSWVYEVIEREGFWTEPEGHCGGLTPDGAVGGCASRGAVSANYGETVGSGELDWSGTLPSIVPHEMYHSVQDVLDPEPMGQISPVGEPTHRPLWFWEGGAEFFGYAVGDYAGVASYYVSPWEWWYYLPNPEIGLENFAERDRFATPPEGYWIGQIATEYIVANVGVEGMLSISQGLSQGLTWEEAFKFGTGLPLDEFYPLFDEAYQNIFDSNEDLKTYLNRECPGQWNCSVQRGSEDFAEVEAEYAAKDGDPGGNCYGEWWSCIETDVRLPEQPENSDHGAPLNTEAFFSLSNCDELLSGKISEFGGVKLPIAASFELAESLGIDAIVSTEWYANWYKFDTNVDGIVCGPGDDR